MVFSRAGAGGYHRIVSAPFCGLFRVTTEIMEFPMLTTLILIGAFFAWSADLEEQANTPKGAEETASPASKEAERVEAPAEGLWPSTKLMNSMLARWAEEMGEQFELNESQREKVREGVRDRWSSFLQDNRSKIQPIVNEFIEMRMELKPPDKDRVREWADRATPVFDMFREEIREGQDEFREILTPMQRAKFEVEAMKFGMGLGMAEQKLKQWREGTFEANEFWEPMGRDRRRRRGNRDRTRETTEVAEQGASDPVGEELRGWEKYVADFIVNYKLDDGQKTTALSCLSELKDRADAHRNSRKEEISKLEERIQDPSKSPEELADIKKQLTELYGPIDEMFQELKRRLEAIPSAQQRADVVAGQVKTEEKRQ